MIILLIILCALLFVVNTMLFARNVELHRKMSGVNRENEMLRRRG